MSNSNNKNLKFYDEMYAKPFLWWVKKKFLREWHQLLYKLRFEKRASEHQGLELILPLTNWMGKYLTVPNEFFMSKSIHAALMMKPGAAIDIGTHAGEFLVRYKAVSKQLGIKDSIYFGFEPNHASFSFMNELIAANNWTSSCHVLPVALADSTELRTFYASRYADPCASIHREINKGTDSFNSIVPTFEADEIINQLDIDKLSIIKIDTEGAELDVLKGLAKTIEKHQPCIHCELANIPGFDDATYQYTVENNMEVIRVMSGMNYQSYKIEEDGAFYHKPLKYKNYLPYLNGPLDDSAIPDGGNYIMVHKNDIAEMLSLMGKN